MNTFDQRLKKLKTDSNITQNNLAKDLNLTTISTSDKEFNQLINDTYTFITLLEFKDLSDTDKQEVINFIKFKKQQNK